jgi:hypothetical protein
MTRSSSMILGMVACSVCFIGLKAVAAEDGYQKMQVICTVLHGSYRGVVVSPGALEATGPVSRLTCNGNAIELSSTDMTGGRIKTKAFGDVDVHLASTATAVGAPAYAQLPKGKTLRERAIEVYVPADKAAEFTKYVSMTN